MSNEAQVSDQAQVDMKDSILSNEQPQCPFDSKGLRRRRRPKRHRVGYQSGSLIDPGELGVHDQWYDAPYQLLSSGCVTPMENDLKVETPKVKALQALPRLLYERELFGLLGNDRQYRRNNSSWMRQMLSDTNGVDCDNMRAPQRLYYKQALKFCYLRTSIMDAVLGIEPKGSYVVAIGKRYDEDNHLLYLRFCGLPSCKNHTLSVAPLLMSIPLVEVQHNTEHPLDYWTQITPERCPLRVWLSTDELFGACMYRTIRSIRNKAANVILFPLPRAISSKQDLSHIDDANLLIHVSCFPNHKTSSTIDNQTHWVCDTVTRGILAYLFLIDVEDGFHLTWIRESAWVECELYAQHIVPLWEHIETDIANNEAMQQRKRQCLPGIVRGTEHSRIVVPMSNDDSGWQTMIGNPITGDFRMSTQESGTITAQFTIAFSSFFSVSSLLLDILTRRPKLVSPRFCGSPTNLPNFTYHLVHVNDGRVAEVLVVFAIGPIGRGCLGLFVEVDLFTQDYREIEWIKHPAHDSPPPTCARLAFDRRKHQVDINTIHSNMGDSILDILYPDCVTMDNTAIRRQVPTMFMSARSANVTISYI